MIYHSSIVCSKPLSPLCGRNLNFASAFRAVWAQPNSINWSVLLPNSQHRMICTNYEGQIRSWCVPYPPKYLRQPCRVIHVQHYIIQIDTQCEYVITVIPKSCHVLSDQRCYSSSLEKVCICTERIEKSKPFLKALIFEGLLLLKMPITC